MLPNAAGHRHFLDLRRQINAKLTTTILGREAFVKRAVLAARVLLDVHHVADEEADSKSPSCKPKIIDR